MALSDDLRKRVVEAVVVDGLSRNAAAKVHDRPINAALFEEWLDGDPRHPAPAGWSGDAPPRKRERPRRAR